MASSVNCSNLLLSSPIKKSSDRTRSSSCLPLQRLPSKQLIRADIRRLPSFVRRSVAVERRPEMVVGLPRSVPVRLAHELLLAGHLYLDVRTEDEFNTGHVEGAINIPYMFKTGAGMTLNPNFVEQVASVFWKDDEIIIGCQSGKRSLMAAADLLAAGFNGVIDIAGGYSAWAQIGLPMYQ